MIKHLNISVSGIVQGVYFRDSAKQKANELGVNGFARNEPDGGVYIEAEGAEDDLKLFVAWCHEGPPRAKVEKVQVDSGEIKKLSPFQVQF